MSRYDRQLPLIGEDGQKRLSEVKVGIVGCGGLGIHVCTLLASAGVRNFTLIDGDVPSESNLNRQYIFREGMERPKCQILKDWILGIDKDAEVGTVVGFIPLESSALDDRDIIVDCLDNIMGKKALNAYAVSNNMILVHGGVTGFHGQVTVVDPGVTPCLHCILSGRDTPVQPSISPAVSVTASLMAGEVIKIVTGMGEPLKGKMLIFDMLDDSFETIPISKRPDCPMCSEVCR